MGKIIVFTNLTLDGVMQAPGSADEDPRGSFRHGGWAAPYAAMQQTGDMLAYRGVLLFGRRTYENFYAVWPKRTDSPYSQMLDNAEKYVVSETLSEPLPWGNSRLIQGDVAKQLLELKTVQDKNLVVMGSGELVQSLKRWNLVDEYLLLIHPLVLGSGRRLFNDDGVMVNLRLREQRATPSGVIIASYLPAETAGGETA